MKKILIFLGCAVALMTIAVLANPVLAQNASVTASSTAKRAAKLDQATTLLRTRADKELDRRIVALNKLQDKIQSMNKVSAADKSSFATMTQEQINLLGNLKIKIDADVDATTLKADVQSVTKTYRIYALILPQMQIMATADRLASSTDLLSAYLVKLQARVTAGQTSGKDVTALQSLITDMNVKIADANIKAASAMVGVVSLKPDNGDKTIMTSNTAALKAARASLKTGIQDLKDAVKDGLKIRAGLKKNEKATAAGVATSTATTTPRLRPK